ncbi:MAG: hypothetical protein H7Y11_15990 [Armatimonadetes bacterium]|nr:hypothetical protein [Anaerolineae bacterium]
MNIETLFAVVLGIGYLVIVYFWITNYFKRIEPYLLRKLGDRLGVKIQRSGRHWKIASAESTWQQGCLVDILELVVTMTLLNAPFWILISAVGVGLVLSGGG